MISDKDLAKIEGLLKESDLSQRAIARITGINRNTVNRIAQGKRPDFKTLRKDRKRKHHKEVQFRKGKPGRCKECGAMVCMPCLLCSIRKKNVDWQCGILDACVHYDIKPLGVELAGEERRRYEQLREEKHNQGEELCDDDGSYVEPWTAPISIEVFNLYEYASTATVDGGPL